MAQDRRPDDRDPEALADTFYEGWRIGRLVGRSEAEDGEAVMRAAVLREARDVIIGSGAQAHASGEYLTRITGVLDELERRAALAAADGEADPIAEATTVTEWGARARSGLVWFPAPNGGLPCASAEDVRAHLGSHTGDEVVSRQRTSYADHVTDWAPVDGSA